MDELHKDFYDPTDEFKTEPRYFCYELVTELIDTAKKASSEDWHQNKNTIKGFYCFCSHGILQPEKQKTRF